jgi:hypothetical protein
MSSPHQPARPDDDFLCLRGHQFLCNASVQGGHGLIVLEERRLDAPVHCRRSKVCSTSRSSPELFAPLTIYCCRSTLWPCHRTRASTILSRNTLPPLKSPSHPSLLLHLHLHLSPISHLPSPICLSPSTSNLSPHPPLLATTFAFPLSSCSASFTITLQDYTAPEIPSTSPHTIYLPTTLSPSFPCVTSESAHSCHVRNVQVP